MSWVGTVQLTPGRLVYHGTISNIPVHSSFAIGLVLSLYGQLNLRDPSGRTVPLGPDGARAAILPAGVPHAALGGQLGTTEQAEPAEVLIAIVDPHSPAGLGLSARLDRSGLDRYDPDSWLAAAAPCAPLVTRPDPGDPAGTRVVEAALGALADLDPVARPVLHPALARAVDLVPSRLAGGVRLQDLAATVGLSASRLGHLFTVQLGLPYRAYVLWARVQKVVDTLRSGATLTSAAHAAGFTDSAHMNRVCRQFFGLNPSEFVKDLRWM